jgi:hypothetical protein
MLERAFFYSHQVRQGIFSATLAGLLWAGSSSAAQSKTLPETSSSGGRVVGQTTLPRDAPTVSINDVSLPEGNTMHTPHTQFNFTVSLSAPGSQTVSLSAPNAQEVGVSFLTADGSTSKATLATTMTRVSGSCYPTQSTPRSSIRPASV